MAERDYSTMSREQLVSELRRLHADVQSDRRLRLALQRAQEQTVELRTKEASLAQALADVEREQQRWTEIYDQAPVPYVITDVQGIVLSVNFSAAALLSADRQKLVEFPLVGRVGDGYRRVFLDHLRRCRDFSVVEAAVEIISRDGTRRHVQLVSRRMQFPGGTLLMALVDLTAREAAEEARRQAELECLELTQKNLVALAEGQAKDRFLAVLSHELRSPLSPILLTVETLQRNPVPAEKLAPALALIRRNVELEVRLVDDLLDVSRITHGKLRVELEPVDLHAVVAEVVEAGARDATQAEVILRADLRADASRVKGDAARLRQVVWNLVSNALRHTLAGGQVVLSTHNIDADIVLTVRDTGRGIPPELLARIFEPFDQADQPGVDAHGGLGLGLAIARGLVAAHGGHIHAASAGVGHGATFTVELPTLLYATVPTIAAAPVASPPSPLRILVVEDDEDAGEALGEILRARGHHVRLARSMEEALDRAREPFDTVVSDIGLPDGNGVELFHRLREVGMVRGIAISGFGTVADIHRSLDAGFERHLTKPVSIDALLAAVEATDVTESDDAWHRTSPPQRAGLAPARQSRPSSRPRGQRA